MTKKINFKLNSKILKLEQKLIKLKENFDDVLFLLEETYSRFDKEKVLIHNILNMFSHIYFSSQQQQIDQFPKFLGFNSLSEDKLAKILNAYRIFDYYPNVFLNNETKIRLDTHKLMKDIYIKMLQSYFEIIKRDQSLVFDEYEYIDLLTKQDSLLSKVQIELLNKIYSELV